MKRLSSVLPFLIVVVLMFSLVANGADSSPENSGIYGLSILSEYESTVTVTPLLSSGTEASKSTSYSSPYNSYYDDAVKLKVVFSNALKGYNYAILVTEQGSTAADRIVYISQQKATASELTFANVYPKALVSGKSYDIYISSKANNMGKCKVASFSYYIPSQTPQIGEISLSQSSVTVNGKEAASVTASISGADNVQWSVSPENKGVTISESGVITVAGNAVAGTYTITASNAENSQEFQKTATLTVAVEQSSQKKQAIITMENRSITYGDEVTDLGYQSLSGLDSPGDLGTIEGFITDVSRNVGEYEIDASYIPNDKYEVTVIKGKLTITPKSLTDAAISLNKSSYEYTGEAIEPVITVKAGEAELIKNTDYTLSFTSNTSVGTATVTVNGIGNYNGTASKTFSITKAPNTISDFSVTGWTYGDTAVSPAATAKSGEISFVYYTDESCRNATSSSDGTAVSGGLPLYAGIYYVKAVSNDAGNYYPCEEVKSLTISKKSVIAQWSSDALTYSGITQAPKAYITGVNSEIITLSVAGNGVNAGENYTASASLSHRNYELSQAGSTVTYSINKAVLTPSVESVIDKTFDGTVSGSGRISLTGGVNGEAPEATGTFSWVYASAGTDKVNVSAITLGEVWQSNYELSVTELSNQAAGKSIKKASAVSLAAEEKDISTGIIQGTLNFCFDMSEYASKLPSDAGIVNFTVKEGTSIDGAAVQNGQLVFTLGCIKAAGEKETVVLAVSSQNYSDSELTLYLNYSEKKDISANLSMSDINTIYGDTFAPEITYGTASEWSFSYESANYSRSSVKPVNSGTYTVTGEYSDDIVENGILGHKGTVTVQLVIAPKPVSISWDDPQNCIYDKNEKTVTASVCNAVNGDTVNVTLTDYKAINAGTYTAMASAVDNTNYTITGGTNLTHEWTIGKAHAVITIAEAYKFYGEDDPEFEGTITGVLDGDDLGVRYSRVSEDNGKNSVGSDITITAVWNNSNYDAEVITNKLIINRAPQQSIALSASSISKTWGDGDFEITASGGSGNGAFKLFVKEYSQDIVDISLKEGTSNVFIVSMKDIGSTTLQLTKYGDDNYMQKKQGAEVEISISKLQVAFPAAHDTDFTYDGKPHTYELTSSDYYTIHGNVRTDAGNVAASLALRDVEHTEWTDGSAEAKIYGFVIKRADRNLSVSPEGIFLTPYELVASLVPDYDDIDGSGIPEYTSSDTGVAAVDRTGKIEAVGNGDAIITITLPETTNYSRTEKTVAVRVITKPVQSVAVKDMKGLTASSSGTDVSLSGSIYEEVNEVTLCVNGDNYILRKSEAGWTGTIEVSGIFVPVSFDDVVLMPENVILIEAVTEAEISEEFVGDKTKLDLSSAVAEGLNESAANELAAEAIILLDNPDVARVDIETSIEIMATGLSLETAFETFSLSITPKYEMKAFDSEGRQIEEVSKEEELPNEYIKAPVTITFKLPEGFPDVYLYAKHYLDDEHSAFEMIKVNVDQTTRMASFSMTHFSDVDIVLDARWAKITFELSDKEITRTYYPENLGEKFPTDAKEGFTFDGWKINGNTYTELSMELLSAITRTPQTAVPVFTENRSDTPQDNQGNGGTDTPAPAPAPSAGGGGGTAVVPETPEPVIKTFSDVKETDWFYDAVMWAIENGVTSGTGDGSTFSPSDKCSRAEIIQFIYNFAGRPATDRSILSKFMDVSEVAWYSNAVAWAANLEITHGTGDGTTFSPTASCTRAQIVTLLWNCFGSPEADKTVLSKFSDVDGTEWYSEAVAWALTYGITSGTGDGTTFSPNDVCTRAQAVTFMYNTFGK